ncbi:MAG TPA: nitrile hydratase accessory protein [Kiloniellales bacterium]|nr:nitrile hydratase accessory protein [Kiloniellales bacterium]
MNRSELPLPKEGEPLFAEAWQAEVLGVAEAMVLAGRFSREQWSQTLGACLREAQAAGEPDEACTYYQAALEALERLVEQTGAASHDEIHAREEAWREAYERTPHGQPVVLGN